MFLNSGTVQSPLNYRKACWPHTTREDRTLYAACRSVISPNEFIAQRDKFEDRERELSGQDGFEKIVTQVAGLEKQQGIYDLARFIPKT